MQFRLLTYNIHKGIGGVDRKYRPERVVATIAHCAPDIVLLQEVDDGVPRSHHHRQVDLLADQLGLPYRAFQRNVTLREGHETIPGPVQRPGCRPAWRACPERGTIRSATLAC